MRKTQRRKLYGRSRRRQRGKGIGKAVCAAVLVAAIASLPAETHAKEDLGFRGLVSNWWNNPNTFDIGPSVELADYITDMKWAPSLDFYPETCATSSRSDEAKVVESYLLPDVGLSELKYGPTYKWNDKEFTYDTWNNKGDTALITPGTGAPFEVPIDAKFKVLSVPPAPEEHDDADGGRRRRRVSRKPRRKTLRRK